jgi:hypothetical protein
MVKLNIFYFFENAALIFFFSNFCYAIVLNVFRKYILKVVQRQEY